MRLYARKTFKAHWLKMFSSHRVVDENIGAIGIKNRNIIRNPT